MTRQAKIGITLGSLLVLGGVFALDAMIVERSLTGDLLGWQAPAPVEAAVPFEHLMDIIRQQGLTILSTDDTGFLNEVLPVELPRERLVLLKDDDRAAFVEWVGTEAAQRYFLILKTVLYENFSESVRGVKDETWNEWTNVLTFQDPQLSEEWFMFVRLADQLLEFRIPDAMLEEIYRLLTAIVSSSR